MKKSTVVIIAIVALVAAFVTGWELAPQKVSVEGTFSLPDAYLAYQHYYEVADKALSEGKPLNKKKLELAKSQIDSVMHFQVLEWPEIVDQRDQLSDVIRCLHDNDPDHKKDIEEILNFFSGRSIEDISQWSFSY